MNSFELSNPRPELNTNNSLSEVVLVADTSTRGGSAYRSSQDEGSFRGGVSQRAGKNFAGRSLPDQNGRLPTSELAQQETRRGSDGAPQSQDSKDADKAESSEPTAKHKQQGLVRKTLQYTGSYFAKWKGQGGQAPDVPHWDQLLASLVGGYLGMLALTGFHQFFFHFAHIDLLIASFGASAVILYAVPDSPLGTPRAFVGKISGSGNLSTLKKTNWWLGRKAVL